MQRHESEIAVRGDAECPGAVEVGQQAVHHDVAHQMNASGIDAFGEQVRVRICGRGEVPTGDAVDDDPVDLLGHRPIERSQSRFEVGDRDAELGRDDGAGGGGVDVADDDDGVGRVRIDPLFEGDHDAGGLYRMAAGADAQVGVGLADVEVGEEAVGHGGVVVLAGVDQRDVLIAGREGVQQWRDLHEVRPGGGDHHRTVDRCVHRRALQRSRMVRRMKMELPRT